MQVPFFSQGNGRGLRRPVRLRVGTSGAGPGPNAVRPYVARGGEVWRIGRKGVRYLSSLSSPVPAQTIVRSGGQILIGGTATGFYAGSCGSLAD